MMLNDDSSETFTFLAGVGFSSSVHLFIFFSTGFMKLIEF